MMHRTRAGLAASVLLLVSCPAPRRLTWTGWTGLSTPAADRALTPGTHYTSLSVQELFLPSVPGLGPVAAAAVGVEIEGALPAHAIAHVTAPVRADPDGSLRIHNFPRVGFFPYRGQGLTLRITVRELAGEETSFLRGMIAGFGGALDPLDPRSARHISFARISFAKVFASPAKPTFRFSIAIPAPLTAGEHVVAPAPASAGDVPVIREGRYREGPYAVLILDRRERHPGGFPPAIRDALAEIARLTDAKELSKAGEAVERAAKILREDPHLVDSERAFATRLFAVHRKHLEEVVALRNGDPAGAQAKRIEQTRLLRAILVDLRGWLAPSDTATLQAWLGEIESRRQ